MSGILFATHGGASAEGAARVSALLAKRLRTTVHAVCVTELLPVVDTGFGVVYPPGAHEQEAMERALATAVSDQLTRCGIMSAPQMRLGPPAGEIAAAARQLAADVIVVGLGPHHLVDRAMGHETALQLVQLAATPVLAVPEAAHALPHHVVAAVDFSPTSTACVRTAARWLVPGDVLHLVHVLPPRSHGTSHTYRAAAERGLAAVGEDAAPAQGVIVDCSLVAGDPATQLLEVTTGRQADLVALGSHGYGVWKRLALGSVASKIIRLAQVPVLVTPMASLGSATFA